MGTKRETVSFKINEGKIENLRPGTQYAIVVAGIKNGNQGKQHSMIYQWTVPNPVDPNSVTTDTRVDAMANHQVDIYFDPPELGRADNLLVEAKVTPKNSMRSSCVLTLSLMFISYYF